MSVRNRRSALRKFQNSTDLVLYTTFHVDFYINIKLGFDVLTAVTMRNTVLDVT
jgi:hypothetical protein